MERAAEVAIQARRLQLLSQHPEALYAPTAEDRAEYVSNAAWSYLDVILAASACEADLICAEAIVQIRDALADERMGGGPSDVEAKLDLLSIMPPDRLLAVYFALPGEDRAVCSSHYVWASHLEAAPDGDAIARCLDEISSLDEWQRDFAASLDLDEEETEDYIKFTNQNLRRVAGLSHNLNPDQEAIAEAGDAFAEALRSS